MSTWRILTTAAALLVLVPGLGAQERADTLRPRGEIEMRGMRGGMRGPARGMMMRGRMQRGMMGRAMMARGTMGRMGMRAGAAGPGLLLRTRDALDLTDDQVERLETLQAELRETGRAHMEQARDAQQRAREALSAETPDLAAAEAALQEAADHRIQAQLAMARGHLQAREILTDDQRTRLEETRELIRDLRPARPGRPGRMRGGAGMGPRGEGTPPPPSP